MALVVCLVVGVRGLLAHGPPADWDADGTLVIDRDTGGRYLATGGMLRPVPNLTSLRLLSGGALPRSVQVDHGLLATRSFGPAIGIPGAPDQPPALVDPPARWVACQSGQDELHLLIGLPPEAGQASPLDLLLPPTAGSGGGPTAPFMADDTLVVDRSSGLQYLAAGGELHRVVNRTSLLLLERPVRARTQMSADAVAAQPLGEPFGLPDAWHSVFG